MSHIDADRTLRDLLRSDGRLSYEHTARLLTDLARSLEPLHSAGQGHGAITPQSVYLDATGNAYLGPPASDATATSLLPAAYLSPERIDGHPADPRSDVYTLGLLGWEMLAGQTPWAGESLSDVVLHQRERDLPALRTFHDDVPETLRAAIEGALQKNPADRWASATAMLAALGGNDVASARFDRPASTAAAAASAAAARAARTATTNPADHGRATAAAAAAAAAAVAAARPTVPASETTAAERPLRLGPIVARGEPSVPVLPVWTEKPHQWGRSKTMALVVLILAVLVSGAAGVAALTGRHEPQHVTGPWLDSLTSTSAAGEVVTTDTTNGSGAAVRTNPVPVRAERPLVSPDSIDTEPQTSRQHPLGADSVRPPSEPPPDSAARPTTAPVDSTTPAPAPLPAPPASDSAKKPTKPDSVPVKPDTIPSVR